MMTQAPLPLTYKLHDDSLVKTDTGKLKNLNEALGPLEDIPFEIMRTHRSNLPVYTDVKQNSHEITVVRRIFGDLEAFKSELSKVVSNSPIKEKQGRVEISGMHS